MLKTLIHKQLMEIGTFLYYDAKKGTRRDKKGLIGYIFIWLMISFSMMTIFYGAAIGMGEDLFSKGLGWLYFVMMYLAGIVFAVFGSAFTTYNTVYVAKDNEMLLAMPIKKHTLLLARLSGVYIMGLYYLAMVYIPTIIVSINVGGISVGALVGQIWMFILISILVLALSAILGWGVAVSAVYFRNKSYMTVIVSILFIAGFYYIYFKAQQGIEAIVANADRIAASVRSSGFLVYHMGRACTGNIVSLFIETIFVGIVASIVFYILWTNFTKILTIKKGEKKVEYKETKLVQKSVGQALLRKEALRFTNSASYMLNTAIGSVFIMVGAIVILVKIDMIREGVQMLGIGASVRLGIFTAALSAVAVMNDITVPSISMEGKNIWIAQSLPISPWEILKAKLKLHVLVTAVPVLFCGLCVGYVFEMNIQSICFMLVTAVVFVVFSAISGLIIGLKLPNLNWTNETAAIKQSFGVVIALFGNWIIVIALCGGFYFFRNALSIEMYMGIVLLSVILSCKIMLNWIKTKGTKIFANL